MFREWVWGQGGEVHSSKEDYISPYAFTSEHFLLNGLQGVGWIHQPWQSSGKAGARKEKVKIFRAAGGGRSKCKNTERGKDCRSEEFNRKILNRPCIRFWKLVKFIKVEITQKQISVLSGRDGTRFWRDYSQESEGFGNNPDMSVWCEGDVRVEHDTEIMSLSATWVRVVRNKKS